MSRYAVPLVLILWAFSVSVGCDWQPVIVAFVLAGAVVIQGVGTVRLYREHHRRLR